MNTELTPITYEESLKATEEYFNGENLPATVWVDKYNLKDSEGNLYETTPDDTHWRLATEFERIDAKYKNPMLAAEYYDLMKDFKHLIPQGSPMAGIGNNLQIVSLSNCFVIGNEGPQDSYGAVLKIDEEQIQLMKRRGGVGSDLSNIRPAESPVKNSALTSTGIVPFMERYSNSTREVAQAGRRGARMLSIFVHHPESENFIDAKMEQGKVTGANISVKLTDDFMEIVDRTTDKDVERFLELENIILEKYQEKKIPKKIENEFSKLIDKICFTQYYDHIDGTRQTQSIVAKALWDKIMHNAWKSAEPGVLFWDKITSESLAEHYPGFNNISTNPCLTPDTLVTTKDGKVSLISILNDLKENKTVNVLTLNEKTNVLEYKKVQNAFKTKSKEEIEYLLEIETEDSTFQCTPNHKILVTHEDKRSWKSAESLKLYHTLIFHDGNKKIESHIKKITKVEPENVYDLTVEDNHNFFANNILVHNCGELPLPDGDSCRLSVINLYSYVQNKFTDEAYFDFELFKKHSHIHQRIMDNIVDLELEKIDQILAKIEADPESEEIKYREYNLWKRLREKCEQGRRTGSGVTGEGDMLAAMGLKYGTPEATEFAEEVHKVYAIEILRSSVQLAKERGHFPIFDLKYEQNNPFIERIEKEDSDLIKDMRKYGRRNIGLLTIAPVGSISILTQTTSGVECAFMINYTRRRKINPSDKNTRVDFVDEVGDSWQNYNVFHKAFIDWFEANQRNLRSEIDNIEQEEIEEKYTWNECKSYLENLEKEKVQSLIEKSPYYGATSNDVNWVEKVKMQGAIQKWIDHSISVTTNLPKDTPESVVHDVYMTAWKAGCKGATIYVDGSRSGVLVTEEDKKETEIENYFKENHAPRRPKVLEADVHNFTNKGEKWVAFIGKLEDKPYEIFTGPAEEFQIPSSIEVGEITRSKDKDGESVYNFCYEKDGEKICAGDLKKSFDSQFSDVSRMVSALLRHGMPMFYIVNLLGTLNLDGDLITTWKKGAIRILKKYIKEDYDIKGATCQNCGSTNIAMIEGCMTCQDCYSSRCS
jgi:ribonucleoside-diphosphate reductase alpha chain